MHTRKVIAVIHADILAACSGNMRDAALAEWVRHFCGEKSELSPLGEVRVTRNEVSETLACTTEQARRSIERLEALGLVEKRVTGTYKKGKYSILVWLGIRAPNTEGAKMPFPEKQPDPKGIDARSEMGENALSSCLPDPIPNPIERATSERSISEKEKSPSSAPFDEDEIKSLDAFAKVGKASIGMELNAKFLTQAKATGADIDTITAEILDVGHRLKGCGAAKLTRFILRNLDKPKTKKAKKSGALPFDQEQTDRLKAQFASDDIYGDAGEL